MYTSTGSDKQFFWEITHFFYAIDCYPLRRFYSIVIRLRRYSIQLLFGCAVICTSCVIRFALFNCY